MGQFLAGRAILGCSSVLNKIGSPDPFLLGLVFTLDGHRRELCRPTSYMRVKRQCVRIRALYEWVSHLANANYHKNE